MSLSIYIKNPITWSWGKSKSFLKNESSKTSGKTSLGFILSCSSTVLFEKALATSFAILTKSEFAKNDVLLRCVAAVKDFFDIDRWQIGQPIVLSDIAYELSLVDGVASVVPPIDSDTVIKIENKYKAGEGYSGNFYDIKNSLIDGVLYPALDPSIFEVKFPNADIKGKVVGDNLGIVE